MRGGVVVPALPRATVAVTENSRAPRHGGLRAACAHNSPRAATRECTRRADHRVDSGPNATIPTVALFLPLLGLRGSGSDQL